MKSFSWAEIEELNLQLNSIIARIVLPFVKGIIYCEHIPEHVIFPPPPPPTRPPQIEKKEEEEEEEDVKSCAATSE